MKEVMRLLFSDDDAADLWWRQLPDHEWLGRFTFGFPSEGEVVVWEKD
jgi:hypothetical protein